MPNYWKFPYKKFAEIKKSITFASVNNSINNKQIRL